MRRSASLAVIGMFFVMGVSACFFPSYSVTKYTCLECRATLAKRWIYGLLWEHISYDADSRLLLARAPLHQHQWCWCGSKQSYSFGGETIACGRSHPVWNLPVSIQAKYAGMVPPVEFRKVLEAVDSPDRETTNAAIERVCARVNEDK
jgi:hypothetical protein